jgi:AraC-like DNA-binding protein
MRYEEHRPAAPLDRYVECFWLARDDEPAPARSPERVLPDGCVEWIFHLGDPFCRFLPDGAAKRQPSSFVVGEMTRPLLVGRSGRVATLGVRFRPGRAHPFLPVSLAELTDTSATTADLWGAEGASLEDAVMHARSARERRLTLEGFLLRRLGDEPPDPRLESAVDRMLRSGGRASVSALALRAGWSPRQLEREFRRRVGLPPKLFGRIARFQNLVRLSGLHPQRAWADLAAEGGYTDQAHMIRDFREFSGTTPAERRTAEGDLTRNFVAPERIEELLRSPGATDVAFVQDGEPDPL